MIYDLIIIGAGAAGLFAGASLPSPVNGLIIEKSSSPGKKLLMSGGGQCNLTHGGNIKDFNLHYGSNGNKIRSILYRFNNQNVMDFFEKKGVELVLREDGKVFPKTLRARDVLDALVDSCSKNGLRFCYSSPVTGISKESSGHFRIDCKESNYRTKKIIIATGGCSYPTTGSDGSLFPVLKSLGIAIKSTNPALVPIHVHTYPYEELSGISFAYAKVSINNRTENTNALLFTHNCFSGPAILNISRFAAVGDSLAINYYTKKPADVLLRELKSLAPGNQKLIVTVLYEYLNANLTDKRNSSPAEIPKRFIELICKRCGVDYTNKFSQLSGRELALIINMLTADRYTISKLGGYNIAMVTTGGVSLEEVHLKTLESKTIPKLYFAGEVLDIDGDTGGYNLQFAFSSGYLAANQI